MKTFKLKKVPVYVKYKDLTTHEQRLVDRKLILPARAKGDLADEDGRQYVGVALDKITVMFSWNRRDPIGFNERRSNNKGKYGYRVGPIYVDPAYRGQGFATKMLTDLFEGIESYSYIDVNNHASQRAFANAGYVRQDKVSTFKGDDTEYYLYYKEE